MIKTCIDRQEVNTSTISGSNHTTSIPIIYTMLGQLKSSLSNDHHRSVLNNS